jgi:hypothetical protein
MNAEHDKIEKFFFAALVELGIPADKAGDDRYLLTVPTGFQRELDGQDSLLITFDKEVFQKSDESNLEFITPGSPILSWLIEQIRKIGCVFHASVRYDGLEAREMVRNIRDAYTLQNGEVSVSASEYKDRVYVRFHYLVRLNGIENRERLVRISVDEEGDIVSSEQIHLLGKMPVCELSEKRSIPNECIDKVLKRASVEIEKIRTTDEEELRQSLEPKRSSEEKQLREYFARMKEELIGLRDISGAAATEEFLQDQISANDRQMKQRLEDIGERFAVSSESRLVGALLLWHKAFIGELVFKNDRYRRDRKIEMRIHEGKPPAMRCEKSGCPAYHLVFTDDGRLVDSSIVGLCAESGRALPRDEMKLCSITGKLLSPEYVVECPISGETVYSKVLIECPECLERVSPRSIEKMLCVACGHPSQVQKADTRVRNIVRRYPGLENWSKWLLSETRNVYIVELVGRLTLAKVVLRKMDLEVVRCVKKPRIFGSWRQVAMSDLEGRS